MTGLTIGYGELVPKLGVSRVLAILLGVNGVLMTATFAAISVRAIEVTVTAARKEERAQLASKRQAKVMGRALRELQKEREKDGR